MRYVNRRVSAFAVPILALILLTCAFHAFRMLHQVQEPTVKTNICNDKDVGTSVNQDISRLPPTTSQDSGLLSLVKPYSEHRIAVVTFLAPKQGREHFATSLYNSISNYSLPNMLAYTEQHGYPLFFYNTHLVGKGRASYWAKMPILRHYLNTGFYDWILFTDIDVLFMNFSIPLSKFTGATEDHHHFIGTLECGHKNPKSSLIRSGFFMIRNSAIGLEFLDFWENMHDRFKFRPNPEQEALEAMHRMIIWKERIKIFPEAEFHTYPHCYKQGDFSVHFPGPSKGMLPKWFASRAPKLLNKEKLSLNV